MSLFLVLAANKQKTESVAATAAVLAAPKSVLLQSCGSAFPLNTSAEGDPQHLEAQTGLSGVDIPIGSSSRVRGSGNKPNGTIR